MVKRILITLVLLLAVVSRLQAGGRVIITDRDTTSGNQVRACVTTLGLTRAIVAEHSDLYADLGTDPTNAAKVQAIAQLGRGGFVTWIDTTLSTECTDLGAAFPKFVLACAIRGPDVDVHRTQQLGNASTAFCRDGTVVSFKGCPVSE